MIIERTTTRYVAPDDGYTVCFGNRYHAKHRAAGLRYYCFEKKNHNVPERIRAAGFTELQRDDSWPQRDDLTTNRQGLTDLFAI
jgi:hypothetical protein